MMIPETDPHVQGVKDSPRGTPAQRTEMERLETELGDHEAKARKVIEDESAAKEVPSKGWFEARKLGLLLALCTGLALAGCKANAGVPEASASPEKATASGILTKEEVGAIIGQPVTAVEGKNQNLTYKTASLYVETSIEVERNAVMAMDGARKATTLLGGAAEAVPGLGDEAFFGAMSTLYVRKGDSLATIQAPNYQMEAQSKATEKLLAAPLDGKQQAMDELQEVSKTDPTKAGLQGGDAMQGAMAVVNGLSKKQGTVYETRTRATALALAKKLMEKL